MCLVCVWYVFEYKPLNIVSTADMPMTTVTFRRKIAKQGDKRVITIPPIYAEIKPGDVYEVKLISVVEGSE